MARKKLEELTIVDDFMFCTVMRDPKRCKALLEYILGVKIRKIEYLELQKELDIEYDAKGIRLDVYVEDENNTVYDLEIQTTRKKNLPKRTRYYQGIIDLNIIRRGEDYDKLKKSFIIFICTYDPFGKGRYIYTFDQTAREDRSVLLDDEAIKIVLNTKGTIGDISDDLKETLRYMDGHMPATEYTKELDSAVEAVKTSEEWRREYMTLFLRDRENVRLGGYIDKVASIREGSGIVDDAALIKVLRISPAVFYLVKEELTKHPDWDDEQVAEEVEWS